MEAGTPKADLQTADLYFPAWFRLEVGIAVLVSHSHILISLTLSLSSLSLSDFFANDSIDGIDFKKNSSASPLLTHQIFASQRSFFA